jgi:hypothetical protein
VANYAASPVALWLGLGAFAARDGLGMLKRTIDGLRADRAKPTQNRQEAE